MSSNDHNTLNIAALRDRRSNDDADEPEALLELPKMPQQPAPQSTSATANHPQAAAIAREKIAAIPSPHPLSHPDALPAAPTDSLVTNKSMLAQRTDLAPTTVRRTMPSALAPLITAAGIFALVLLLFKAPVVYSQIKYNLGQTSAPESSQANNPASVIPAESTISIPKINIHAPVQYINSTQEADVQRALQDGVVHYSTTANPGQPGNVAIFGHSSNDWWEPGNYKFVFVLLDKLVPGDQVTLDYQSVRYTYEVTGSTIVEPTAVEVLNPTPTPTLSLITCSPPGTSLKRLVVTAKQINPQPKTGAVVVSPNTNSQAQATLPSSAPSFIDQMSNFFTGLWQNVTSIFSPSQP